LGVGRKRIQAWVAGFGDRRGGHREAPTSCASPEDSAATDRRSSASPGRQCSRSGPRPHIARLPGGAGQPTGQLRDRVGVVSEHGPHRRRCRCLIRQIRDSRR
jgi:hypothetical protein